MCNSVEIHSICHLKLDRRNCDNFSSVTKILLHRMTLHGIVFIVHYATETRREKGEHKTERGQKTKDFNE